MIGPDYERPTAPVGSGWIARDGDDIVQHAQPIGPWWETFNDPVLTDLIAEAYRQNPSLQAAGVRVVEAQARRGIAIGTLFPQAQNAVGGYRRTILSENGPLRPTDRSFNEFLLGFASHKGMAATGQLLTIGVALTLVCYVVVLPAVLAWDDRHRKRS